MLHWAVTYFPYAMTEVRNTSGNGWYARTESPA